MGGSILGTQAIYSFLKKKIKKKTYFIDNLASNNIKTKNKNFIFKNADLFVNASHWEGLPNALVQSINYNVFQICSDAPGGNIEVIKNGKFGMSFKTNNKEDLQKKIIKFFDKRFKLKNRSRIIHLKNFTEKKSNEEYLKTLNNLK